MCFELVGRMTVNQPPVRHREMSGHLAHGQSAQGAALPGWDRPRHTSKSITAQTDGGRNRWTPNSIAGCGRTMLEPEATGVVVSHLTALGNFVLSCGCTRVLKLQVDGSGSEFLQGHPVKGTSSLSGGPTIIRLSTMRNSQ
jgi:hypothetical protein